MNYDDWKLASPPEATTRKEHVTIEAVCCLDQINKLYKELIMFFADVDYSAIEIKNADAYYDAWVLSVPGEIHCEDSDEGLDLFLGETKHLIEKELGHEVELEIK